MTVQGTFHALKQQAIAIAEKQSSGGAGLDALQHLRDLNDKATNELIQALEAAGWQPPTPPKPDPPSLWKPSGQAPLFAAHSDIPFGEPTDIGGYAVGSVAGNSDPRAGEPIVGWNSSEFVRIPDGWSHQRAIVWNNDRPSWGGAGDRGPLWGRRGYNLWGVIRDLYQYRVGNWTKGKEGHALYLNQLDNIAAINVHAFECGAQAMQIVFRPGETGAIPGSWPHNTGAKLVLSNVSAINCGAINVGDAPRASWPFALYAPAPIIDIDGMVVRCNLPSFKSSGVNRNSHGGLFIGPAAERPIGYVGPDAVDYAGDTIKWTGFNGQSTQVYAKTESALVRGLDIEVENSDRELVHLRNVGLAELIEPRLINKGGSNRVVLTNDCGTVKIVKPQSPITVEVKKAGQPFGPNLEVHPIAAGEDWEWSS